MLSKAVRHWSGLYSTMHSKMNHYDYQLPRPHSRVSCINLCPFQRYM